MQDQVRRLYVTKKSGFDVAARGVLHDLRSNLSITALTDVKMFVRYDVLGLSAAQFERAVTVVFSEPNVDDVYPEALPDLPGARLLAVEYLPGQFDQRADSAAQCAQLITQKERPQVRTATVYAFEGDLDADAFEKIRDYLINPVESREASMDKPDTLALPTQPPEPVKIMEGFTALSEDELTGMVSELAMAMTAQDLIMVQAYFRDEARRDPSLTELRVLDTYWSDHCRHTTFLTALDQVTFDTDKMLTPVVCAYRDYLKLREELYADRKRDVTLMDIAVIGMKALKKMGKLPDLDQSEEINACSIVIEADVDGEAQPWLLMFKNETHNHPTEIEPFGGAATCLGGAIRDPLSGRAYVYQAMRITGAADPRTPLNETIPGKLPQKKLTRTAAAGFSAYGNQIGLAAGRIQEVYHPGFAAKRLETGAVIAAVPKENVKRGTPQPGDLVILVGGRTGRDGCGGATGSSKAHTSDSLTTCGAEVQKGNPPTERHIQRLFRNPEFTRMIVRCNDFGAGGVAVAIGELADGLTIDLSAVKRKYEGLDGTELAISESQERMACVIHREDEARFLEMAAGENLEATRVAVVEASPRLVMNWRGETIVDISRAFLDTNGATQHARAHISAPETPDYFTRPPKAIEKCKTLSEAWLRNLQDLNVCSQKGLVERFDGSIGGAGVLSPFGGKTRMTEAEAMVAKLPVMGHTHTCSLMAHGYHAELSSWSPFHGAAYAVVESLSKIAAAGGDARGCRLTFQEYFERLRDVPRRWGKPLAALLGALSAQMALGTAAIGGKDSMSGSFEDIDVPPTLISFAVGVTDARRVISPELKGPGHRLCLLPVVRDEYQLPDYGALLATYDQLRDWIADGRVISAHTVGQGGVAAAVSKMAFGNMVGIKLAEHWSAANLFTCNLGAIVVELNEGVPSMPGAITLGETVAQPEISAAGSQIMLEDALSAWLEPLSSVFPIIAKDETPAATYVPYKTRSAMKPKAKVAKPLVAIPVFPGTNCEYDTQRAFERAGAQVKLIVVRNLTPEMVDESVAALAATIGSAQILALPGGFSGGDEPDGSAKYIAAMLRSPQVAEAIESLLWKRDGLLLGICNGFQALIKLGLITTGHILPALKSGDPTLTYNSLGRHIANTARTVVSSVNSPWMANVNAGDVFEVALSHGEGRLVASDEQLALWQASGQIATQYVDGEGKIAVSMPHNPNGSACAVEGLFSPDGRVYGKMGHTERSLDDRIAINIPGNHYMPIFEAGVDYFR